MRRCYLLRRNRQFIFLMGVVVMGGMVFPVKGDSADPTNTGYASPAEVVGAYRQAIERQDWRTCFLCFTPELRGGYLVEMLAGINMAGDAEVATIVEKHPNSKKISSLFGKAARRRADGQQETDPLVFYQLLEEEVGDSSGLIDSICQHLIKESADKGSFDLFWTIGEVQQLTVDDDRAAVQCAPPSQPVSSDNAAPDQAELVFGKVMSVSVGCRKIGDGWYISTVPKLERKAPREPAIIKSSK
jgi:hypothetical protein